MLNITYSCSPSGVHFTVKMDERGAILVMVLVACVGDDTHGQDRATTHLPNKFSNIVQDGHYNRVASIYLKLAPAAWWLPPRLCRRNAKPAASGLLRWSWHVRANISVMVTCDRSWNVRANVSMKNVCDDYDAQGYSRATSIARHWVILKGIVELHHCYPWNSAIW